jgi:SAM-dependent methyltransferase
LRKYGDSAKQGTVRRMRSWFGYCSPDDFYELLVNKLVDGATRWMDVGCGRNVFPSNAALARELVSRCRLLVGVDPDETLLENPFVHKKLRCSIEDMAEEVPFDLITMRMVAEHVTDPERVLRSLAKLTAAGSCVVVYTVNKWSPASIVAKHTPMSVHHAVKRVLWQTEERDTFPVAYKMNTRATLKRLFEAHGFTERYFSYVDDCRSTSRFPSLHFVELALRASFRAVGLKHPENCLLGVYERTEKLSLAA